MHSLLEVLTNPQWQWAALAIFGTAILQVAAAVWAAGSRRHWFVRALVLWGAIALLVPIRAYEPALLFAISSPLTVAIVLGWQAALLWWTSKFQAMEKETGASARSSATFRFHLRDLLLLMVIVGLAIATLIHIGGNLGLIDWVGLLYTATGLIGLGVAGHAIVFGTHYRKVAVAASVAFIGLAAYLLWIADDWMHFGYLFDKSSYLFANLLGFDTDEAQFDRALAAQVLSCFVMLVTFWRIAIAGRWRPLRTFAAAALSLVIVVALPLWGILYWRMLWPIPIPPAIADEPNHYERILAIAKEVEASKQDMESIADLRVADPRSLVPDRLESLYEEVLRLLESPNSVILPPPVRGGFDAGQTQQLVRVLARSFSAESRQAGKVGDSERAVRFAVANVRLGGMSARGGVALDLLVGVAVQELGASHLASFRRDLPAHLEREVLESLAKSLNAIEPPEDIQRRSAAHYDRWDSWRGRLHLEIDKLQGKDCEEGVLIAHSRRLATLRLLQADLAIRAFHRNHNRRPESLTELAAELKDFEPIRLIPSYHTLHYRPADDDFLLFAIDQLAPDHNKLHRFDFADGRPHGSILFLDDIAQKFE